ncbi:MAG TPA: NAD(P)-binding protein [Steroidobacteraceae bacterium]
MEATVIRATTEAFDFIVVGGGIAGAGVAAALAPTARVALIEAEPQPGFDAREGVEVGAWPAVFDVDEEFYFKPDDAYADDLTVALAVERIEGVLDVQVRRVRHSWAGLRTFAPLQRVPLPAAPRRRALVMGLLVALRARLFGVGRRRPRRERRRGCAARLFGALLVACGLWTAIVPVAILRGSLPHQHQSSALPHASGAEGRT